MDIPTCILPTQALLDWWAGRDNLGGFRTVGARLFPEWKPGRVCRPPNRPIPDLCFSIAKNDSGQWRFRDNNCAIEGDLLKFMTLSGMSPSAAAVWLKQKADEACKGVPVSVKTASSDPSAPRIRFLGPADLCNYEPTGEITLAGDCHIMRGEVFVIGGEPGLGKSRAATALAIAGATGPAPSGEAGTGRAIGSWLGLPVHRQFRTMIIQTENGRYRLRQEFSNFPCGNLEPWIRISEPPPFGITLRDEKFQADIRDAIHAFKPDCVILDPWNAASRDDKQRNYSGTFDALRNLLPTGADKPALGIVAHTRKPMPNEKRTGGTGLMHLLAGSYILGSVPRCVFIMTRASEDETDNRVVWFNPKNNNGALAPRTAWRRIATGYEPVEDFDWDAFERPAQKGAPSIVTIEHLRRLFEAAPSMNLSAAVKRLQDIAGISKPAAYNILNGDGRFAKNLRRDGKLLAFSE